MWILAVGNPFDGLTLYHGFDNRDEARVWAETYARDEWFIVNAQHCAKLI